MPRRSLTAACAMAFLLVAAACAGGVGAGDRRTVGFLVFGEPEEVAAYTSVVEAFEAQTDTVEVELIVASSRSDLLTRISTAIAAGSPPELFLVNYRFYGQFASKGALAPLTERFEAAPDFHPDDFYPVALDAFRWGDEQMCLPQNVSSLAVYYNKDLFAEAGIDEPADSWTWFEMVDAAAALTVDIDVDGTIDQHGLGVDPGIIRVVPFIWSAGGEVFDDELQPTRYTLDNAPAIRAIQQFIDLRAGLGLIPSDQEMESEELESRFLNGRLGMYMSSRRAVPHLRSIEDFEWDVAPIPTNGQPANVLHSDAFCLTADSKNHDAAWEFVHFALGVEGASILATTGRTVPSRIEVAESPAFLDPSSPPSRAQVFLDNIPHLRRLPALSTWPEIEDLSDVLIEEAIFDPLGGEAWELIRSLQTETQDAFERGQR
jgi:multiple sugar transport system substrate-binding protein